MPPRVACPNCKQNEWLENSGLHYIPKIDKVDDTHYEVDASNGIHVRIWRCNNCMYVMHFWEPD